MHTVKSQYCSSLSVIAVAMLCTEAGCSGWMGSCDVFGDSQSQMRRRRRRRHRRKHSRSSLAVGIFNY